MTQSKYQVGHNDFWNADNSNFGQFYVGKIIEAAAAYDATVRPVVWLQKSPWIGGSEQHLNHNRNMERLARIICEAMNAAGYEEAELPPSWITAEAESFAA